MDHLSGAQLRANTTIRWISKASDGDGSDSGDVSNVFNDPDELVQMQRDFDVDMLVQTKKS